MAEWSKYYPTVTQPPSAENLAALLTMPPIQDATGLVIYQPTEKSWRFLALAMMEDELPLPIPAGALHQNPSVVAVWKAGEGGTIHRWEQVLLEDGITYLARRFRGVEGIGSFGKGQLDRARLYRWIYDEGWRWMEQEVNFDGTLGQKGYRDSGSFMTSSSFEVQQATGVRARATAELRAAHQAA